MCVCASQGAGGRDEGREGGTCKDSGSWVSLVEMGLKCVLRKALGFLSAGFQNFLRSPHTCITLRALLPREQFLVAVIFDAKPRQGNEAGGCVWEGGRRGNAWK